MDKLFTLEEAERMLPTLGPLLARAREAAVRAAEVDGQMQALSQKIFLSGGLHVDVAKAARRRAEREEAMTETRARIGEIEETGAKVAEHEEGGLEFPYLLEGRTVLLCWAMGEDEINAWREEADEPTERRDLDGRFGTGRAEGGRFN